HRRQDRGVVGRLVLEVCVLDQHVLAARAGERGADRGPLAAVVLVAQEPHPPVERSGGPLQLFGRSIARAVVADDDLLVESLCGEVGGGGAPDHLADGARLVVGGHDDREQPRHRGMIPRETNRQRAASNSERGGCEWRSMLQSMHAREKWPYLTV